MKKTRGHKRIWKDIQRWRASNLELDLDRLKESQRDYVKIWIHPFSSISLSYNRIPLPKGETKKRILNGLFDIYESWKNQLDSLNEPYYLKIWLFEPRFSKSQVVCSIGSFIDFYQKTFSPAEDAQKVKNDYSGDIKSRIDGFHWEHRMDEEFMSKTDLGETEDFATEEDFLENKRWFEAQLKRPHRTIIWKDSNGEPLESYGFKQGDVWLGE